MHPIIAATPSELASVMAELAHQTLVGIDTESNSLYAYKERLCLVQISTPEKDYIIDTVLLADISPLKKILSDPFHKKIFHSTDQDIRILKRRLHCEVNNIFDTMSAARYLGLEKCGLNSLLSDFFNVKLEKKYQKADWGFRPLDRGMLEYAANDTHYLIPLAGKLERMLEEKGLSGEMCEEFVRLTSVGPETKSFNPRGYLNIKDTRLLSGRQLAVLKEIYLAREIKAEELDRPVFKVLMNELMTRIAKEPHMALDSLERFRGVTPYIVRKHKSWILEAVKRGLSFPEIVITAHKHAKSPELAAQDSRLKLLKAWRKQKAADAGVEPDVILPGATLARIASANPATCEELDGIEGFGKIKQKNYSKELLEILKKHDYTD